MESKEFQSSIEQTITKVSQMVWDAQKRANQLKIFATEMKNAQDNPAVHRLGRKCFTISSTEFAGGIPMTPSYHDFTTAYEDISEAIIKLDKKMPLDFITEVIAERCIRYGSRNTRLHPKVLAFLGEIKNKMQAAA